jgi:hypothetical protein
MKLHENLVEIHPIWWPPDGFCSQLVEVLVQNLCNYIKRWLKYVLFGAHHMGFVPQPIEFGFKFSFLLKIYANYMKRWLKYVLFGGH